MRIHERNRRPDEIHRLVLCSHRQLLNAFAKQPSMEMKARLLDRIEVSTRGLLTKQFAHVTHFAKESDHGSRATGPLRGRKYRCGYDALLLFRVRPSSQAFFRLCPATGVF
jgi:hypothetical protein